MFRRNGGPAGSADGGAGDAELAESEEMAGSIGGCAGLLACCSLLLGAEVESVATGLILLLNETLLGLLKSIFDC